MCLKTLGSKLFICSYFHKISFYLILKWLWFLYYVCIDLLRLLTCSDSQSPFFCTSLVTGTVGPAAKQSVRSSPSTGAPTCPAITTSFTSSLTFEAPKGRVPDHCTGTWEASRCKTRSLSSGQFLNYHGAARTLAQSQGGILQTINTNLVAIARRVRENDPVSLWEVFTWKFVGWTKI